MSYAAGDAATSSSFSFP